MNKSTPEVRVGVFWKASKGRYFLIWQEPGKSSRSTRQTSITTESKRSEREAYRLAEALQNEINERLRGQDSDPWWFDFCQLYQSDHLAHTSPDNQYKWRAVANIFDEVVEERYGRPIRLSDITPLFVAQVETAMRDRLAPGSIPSYMATLRGAFSWAAAMELMRELPRRRRRGREEIELPAMRLRPIGEKDLRKICRAARQVVGAQHAASMTRYLRCLWLSGCRMREPLEIHASRLDCHHPLGLDGPQPRFCWTSSQKNRRDLIRRITLDFAADVRKVITTRSDFPYRPTCETGVIQSRAHLTKVVAAVGKKAKVIAEPGDNPKYATAKHFRSSFVQRWSARGMPIEMIQHICRHQHRSTTERYYLGDAAKAAEFDETEWIVDQSVDQTA